MKSERLQLSGKGLPDGSLLPREYPARIRSVAIASPWSENTNQRVATTPERTLCSSRSIDWEWTKLCDGAVKNCAHRFLGRDVGPHVTYTGFTVASWKGLGDSAQFPLLRAECGLIRDEDKGTRC